MLPILSSRSALETWLRSHVTAAVLKDFRLPQREYMTLHLPHNALLLTEHKQLVSDNVVMASPPPSKQSLFTQSQRMLCHVPSSLMVDLATAQQQQHCSMGESSSAIAGGADTAVVYDVIRCRPSGPLFAEEHLQRFRRSLLLYFASPSWAAARPGGADSSPNDGTALRSTSSYYELAADELTSMARELLQRTIAAQHDKNIEQNVKLIAWVSQQQQQPPQPPSTEFETTAAIVSSFSLASFFIRSTYPPSEWYRDGCTCALLYHAMRSNPNAKIVQSALRDRAAQQQTEMGCFESFLVHDDAQRKVTEGSRSNLLVVLPEPSSEEEGRPTEEKGAHGLEQVCCALEKDILVGVTLLGVRRAMSSTDTKEETEGVLLWRGPTPTVHHRDLSVADMVLRSVGLAMLGTSVGVLPINRLVVFGNDEEQQEFLRALHFGEEKQDDADTAEYLVKKLAQHGVRLTLENGGSKGVIWKESATNASIQRLIEKYNASAYH